MGYLSYSPKLKMNKKGYEFSFAWIFAVLVGAFIIFLAIYAVFKIVEIGRLGSDTTRAKEIGNLLTPSETGLEDIKFAVLGLPRNQHTRLFNDCIAPSAENIFGTQKISALVKSGVGSTWQPEPGVSSSFHNKYLFARDDIEAEKEFYVLSKPLIYPFKIADLIIVWPDTQKYCFVDTIPELEQELKDAGVDKKNVAFVNSVSSCDVGSIRVCFYVSGSDCDVVVKNGNIVSYPEFGNQQESYTDASDPTNKYGLMLAAIFSSPEKFNCENRRLAARASNLANLLKLKSNYLTSTGKCRSAPLLPVSLQNYIDKSSSISLTGDLTQLEIEAEDLKLKNEGLDCRLF